MTDPMPTPSLAEALAKVQAALPVVHRGKTASIKSDKGSYGYSYADLSDVTAAIMPLLSKHGLAFSCLPRLTDKGGYELSARLLHTSGESIEGALPLTGGTPQQLGSSLTYMRRYLLGALTGVVTDSDDDAKLATEAAKQARREVHRQQAEESVPKVTEGQGKKIHAALNQLGRTDRDDKLKLYSYIAKRGIGSTKELTLKEAGDVIEYLEARIAEQSVTDEESAS